MHKNEQLLRKMDEAVQKGDVPTMLSCFSDDVVIHIGGRNKLSGVYKGKEQLAETFGRFMQAVGESEFDTHDVLANDTHGIILQTLRANRGGERVSIDGVAIFHFKDGKATEAFFNDADPYTADPFYDGGL